MRFCKLQVTTVGSQQGGTFSSVEKLVNVCTIVGKVTGRGRVRCQMTYHSWYCFDPAGPFSDFTTIRNSNWWAGNGGLEAPVRHTIKCNM